MADQEAQQDKRERSPKAPVFGLDVALDRLRAFYSTEKRASVDRLTAVLAIGFSSLNGTAMQALATLLQFGLLERTGNNKVRVSDLGLKLVLEDHDSSIYKEALLQAFANPVSFRWLNEEFSADLPSDGAMKSYLIRDRRFSDLAAAKLVRSFRASRDLIGEIEPQAEPVGISAESADGESLQIPPPLPLLQSRSNLLPTPNAVPSELHERGLLNLPLPLGGMSGTLQIPMRIGRLKFELLKRKIAALLDVYEEQIVGETENERVPKGHINE